MGPRLNHVPLRGSERAELALPRIAAAPRRAPLPVTVVLRPRQPGLRAAAFAASDRPPELRHLTRGDLVERFGAAPEDVARVRRFARNNGLHVVRVDRAARTVELSGSTGRVSRAFGVELSLFRTPFGVVRGRSGPIHVPQWLLPSIQGVFGLDTRRQARPHFRVLPGEFVPAAGPSEPFTPIELSRLYRFPSDADGSGETIALIELGGGFRRRDLRRYFDSLGIDPPRVQTRSVGGAANHPTGNPNGPDGEVVLDIEVAGAVAHGAKIVVYFAPNTTKGFLDAVNAAVHDTTQDISVLSISWGAAESAWTPRAMNALNGAFQTASLLGISVFCASGDNGSDDGVGDGRAHVDFPASSPFAVGCGGTTLEADGTAITREEVWNEDGATGGGVSDHFPVPPYQDDLRPTSANPPGTRHGRGVPDVAAVSDPRTGFRVLVDGQSMVIGGTSAAAPLWAGLTARIQQAAGQRVAPVHATLYRSPGAFRDIRAGDNGDYAARHGWDACTGLGSPRGEALLAALAGSPFDAQATSSPAASAQASQEASSASSSEASEADVTSESEAEETTAAPSRSVARRTPRKATKRSPGR